MTIVTSNKIASEYAHILGDNLVGIYVHDSIAFGYWCCEKRYIGFIVTVMRLLMHSQNRMTRFRIHPLPIHK